jgi:hypothetical protein
MMDRAIASLLRKERNMMETGWQSDNGHEALDELLYEDLFDEDALVRRAIRSDDFNVSGEWRWHEREAYMRWSSPELYEDDDAA